MKTLKDFRPIAVFFVAAWIVLCLGILSRDALHSLGGREESPGEPERLSAEEQIAGLERRIGAMAAEAAVDLAYIDRLPERELPADASVLLAPVEEALDGIERELDVLGSMIDRQLMGVESELPELGQPGL